MDGDEIKKMSPGKKALVLLKLLINLAESKCPILIDQPEDDLDNRSVFVELVDFIRNMKLSTKFSTMKKPIPLRYRQKKKGCMISSAMNSASRMTLHTTIKTDLRL